MSSKNKSIQDKIAELNKLVEWFDSKEFTLEFALDKFKEAKLLADDIEKDLMSLKNEIKIIKQKFDKNI